MGYRFTLKDGKEFECADWRTAYNYYSNGWHPLGSTTTAYSTAGYWLYESEEAVTKGEYWMYIPVENVNFITTLKY